MFTHITNQIRDNIYNTEGTNKFEWACGERVMQFQPDELTVITVTNHTTADNRENVLVTYTRLDDHGYTEAQVSKSWFFDNLEPAELEAATDGMLPQLVH